MDNGVVFTRRSLALLGLGLILAAAYVSDKLAFALARSAAQTFVYTPSIWVGSLINIALALAVLTLAAWISTRVERDPVVGGAYLVTGLVLVLTPAILITLDVPGATGSLLAALMSNTRLAFTAGLLAAAGFMHAARRPAR